jgi:starch-binding outer membrane protein, SusD/RagB family
MTKRMKFMKNITNCILALILCVSFTQCKDYLNTTTPANADDEFVTTTTTETFKCLSWCYANYRQNCAMGSYNWNDSFSSDAEHYPESGSANNANARLSPELLSISAVEGGFNNLYITLARAAKIASIIAEKTEYQADVAAGKTSDWTQLYGEAITMRAFCYFMLVKHFGDVPYGYENTYVTNYSLNSRYDIYDKLIADLKRVEPLMYKIGEGSITAERISRTFANALIGQIAFYSAGYQTLRTDVDGLYGNVQFNIIGTDATNKCQYARRTDCVTYYQIAEQYLQAAYDTKGTAQLITTDTRGYNNPFQLHFQYELNLQVSPEMIFEIGVMQGGGTNAVNSEYGYAFVRPSNGGTTTAAPCKAFGALRIIPTVYYGEFESGDKRRDASVAVTGSNGDGNEKILSFAPGSKLTGGISTNKWDENKMNPPYVAACRQSGIDWPILRMADLLLMLAQAKAEIGGTTEEQAAMDLVNQIRDRAFGDTSHRISGLTGDALKAAILQERKLELLGEGTRRWDLILSGKFVERANAVRTEMDNLISDLTTQGYHSFSNGNVISNYIYTKAVALTTPLTYECTDTSDPTLFPGWRGQYNYSSLSAVASKVSGTTHNLAIKGLFNYIDPNGTEATNLVNNNGYSKTIWGANIVTYASVYKANILSGISAAPRYYWPIPYETIRQSSGKITNGYGLAQK